MSHFNYEICERFAPIFLRRTHVKLRNTSLLLRTMSKFLLQNGDWTRTDSVA
ncbi:hypothetical protein [Leptospira noguchii]|uniref:hypothetical protein n=1 Tax=Leptospira noguchii TaxID=28182 RepID=UPI0002E942A6|nr:hypothetical protein [Leptospira noguchii]